MDDVQTDDLIVLPMYMGVIPTIQEITVTRYCAPHVYGGDPNLRLC